MVILIKKILLKNWKRGGEASSKDIGIYISKCPVGFERIINDTLADARNVEYDDIPIMTYDVDRVGRFVRLVMFTSYGSYPTLQYIHFDYDYPAGISNDPYVCPGN